VAEYRNSVRGTTLQGGNARAVWSAYVSGFPAAVTYEERMLLVDRLVHGVHTTRNLATQNLFAGPQRQVLAALDGLAGALTVEEPLPVVPRNPPQCAGLVPGAPEPGK
jgi:hypothetical protein